MSRSDIEWWRAFAATWNGRSICLLSQVSDYSVISDASGYWGCGAFFEHRWFQLQWLDQGTREAHITVKELIPVVVGAAVWGHHWVGKVVTVRSDNMATVEIVNSGTCRDPKAMHLLRSLFFIAAHFHFCLRATHIRGKDNGLADALSRNNHETFLALCSAGQPQTNPDPTTGGEGASYSETRLDLNHLGEDVRFYFRSALAPSTKRTYQSAKNKYIDFCSKGNLALLPISEGTLCLIKPYVRSEAPTDLSGPPSFSKPSLLQIHLKPSKTDPFRKGVDVFIGSSGDDLCPVRAMATYLAARGGGLVCYSVFRMASS